MIEVQNVSKYFGPVLAVDRISFQVAKGEIVGFLGQNGAGKTTAMRILTTYLPATSGVARVAGFDVMNQSLDVRRHIGFLPESVPLYPEMRVEEYLSYRAKLKDVDRKERVKRIDEVLEIARLREVRRRLLGTLSKGYRQRVGLADALVHKPDLLILDEPTSGLDPIQIGETLKTIRELGSKHTVLFSSHYLFEVEEICQRVIIIDHGRIGLDKKLSELENDAPLILLEIRGPVDQVKNVLVSTDGVEAVAAKAIDDGLHSYEVRTEKGQDLREKLLERVSKNGWAVRKLDIRKRQLQDHFMDVAMRSQGSFSRGGPANIVPAEARSA